MEAVDVAREARQQGEGEARSPRGASLIFSKESVAELYPYYTFPIFHGVLILNLG